MAEIQLPTTKRRPEYLVEGTPRPILAQRRERIHMLMQTLAERQRVEWLWKPFLQKGAINLLTGDPGVGKTTLVCEICARLSRGEALPGDQAHPPMTVWVMNGEDGIEDTLVWRLDNQKSDGTRVWLTDKVVTLDATVMAELEEKIRANNIGLLVIDPIQAWIGAGVDMNRANETREWAGRLREVALRTGCSILIVRHRRKGGPGDNNLHAGLGSIDISGFARSEVSVLKAQDGTCYLTRTKGNVGKTGDALAYSLEAHSDPLNDHAVLQWRGTFNPSTDGHKINRTPKRIKQAMDWLSGRLAKGPVDAVTLLKEATQARLSESTLKRAKVLVAESYQTETGWFWRLKDGDIDERTVTGEAPG